MASLNPFESSSTRVSSRRPSSRASSASEPAIWAARNVDWPLPSALPTAHYVRLLKASQQAAVQLGITLPPSSSHARTSSASSALDTMAAAGRGTLGLDSARSPVGTGTLESPAGYYGGGLSGFMSRVLNTSHNSEGSSALNSASADADAAGTAAGTSRPLRAPRPGCVAAANGWIVACLECPIQLSSSGTSPTHAKSNNASLSSLRLVSRWNVRRGHGGMADQWMALPPPVTQLRPTSTSQTAAASASFAKILHVLVDPTASHLLFSASNGECYYIHSSTSPQQNQYPMKLKGFGPNVDGTTLSKDLLTGVPASAMVSRRAGDDPASSKQGTGIQQGLSPGSYVTAVAWDKERGTEGSSKKILLGTSAGEIYEYALTSPNSEDKEDALALPVLLHKLYHHDTADPSEVGAAVTGLHFERLRTGLFVMVATSGRHKRTRFYTFYSPHNSSFRMVMADQQYALLTELPGSVDFAELRLCGDHFGLLSAGGIYFGTIDRALASVGQSSSSVAKMIVDSGIIPYGDGESNSAVAAKGMTIPVSLAVTPHHLITLSETNEVLFLNRVAQKVIQKERLDAGLPMTPTASLDESQLVVGELMMDIRRPDQVWLRRGRGLIHISSSQEDRDVWKFTLQRSLAMPMKNPASPTSRASQSNIDRRVALLGSPSEQLSDDEKAVEALFDQAKSLCTTSAQKAVVTSVRAEYHLCKGRTELAAKYLAQCPSSLEPFADTSIRLGLSKLGIDDPACYNKSPRAREGLERSNLPLIVYLTDKMRVFAMNGDKMSSTMIGAWLTELYLNERGERLAPLLDTESKVSREIDASQRDLLARFLNSNVNHMDSTTIMKILASHDVEAVECSTFATKSGDIFTAINAALSMSSDSAHGVYESLQILDDAPFELAESLYYAHAPTFLARAPSLASNSFIRRYAHGLSPVKLLPTMIKYEEIRAEQARAKQALGPTPKANLQPSTPSDIKTRVVDVMSTGTLDGFELHVQEETSPAQSFEDDPSAIPTYLEGVIKLGCRSSSVYSYLISLYTKLDDEEPLYNFLSAHVPSMSATAEAERKVVQAGVFLDSQHILASPLDMSFALRTVLKSGRHFRSAIILYKGYGMRQQAVELALKVDPSLARELAQESVELEERKRLWLMIAKSAATDPSNRVGKDVVTRVVTVLRECGPDVLSIEEVLPYMPDFASINQIKDEICEALSSYSSKIDSFLKEMSECDQMCDNLRDEIRRLKSHRMRMRPDARCSFTNKLVLNAGEPFYVFPSGFVVLASALTAEVYPYLNKKQQERVQQLERILSSPIDSSGGKAERVEVLQAELDGLIAAECPLTGHVMIESIDRVFDGCEEIYASNASTIVR